MEAEKYEVLEKIGELFPGSVYDFDINNA